MISKQTNHLNMLGKNRTLKTMCPLDAAMSLIEGKWKPMMLCKLLVSGGLRFNELQREMPAVSPRILTKQLREMEEDGLISRVAGEGGSGRTVYKITPFGMTLAPILKDLADWARKNLASGPIIIDGTEEASDGKVSD